MMTEKEKMETLQQIADLVTDLIFCDDENEEQFCEEVICRKLEKLGYVRAEDQEGLGCWVATDKSQYYGNYLMDKEVTNYPEVDDWVIDRKKNYTEGDKNG